VIKLCNRRFFRRLCLILLAAVLMSQGLPSATAATYVTLSGQILDSRGVAVKPPSIVNVVSSSKQFTSQVDSQGKFSVDVLAETAIEVFLVIYEEGYDNRSLPRKTPGFSNWSTKFAGLTRDRVINFKLPSYVQLEVRVTDAQGLLLPNYQLSMIDGNQSHSLYNYDGLTWAGIQAFNSNRESFVSNSGVFVFQAYPTEDFKGFMLREVNGQGFDYSPAFSLLTSKTIQLCVPKNFGSTKTTPDTCLDNVVAAEKSAKAKAEAESKAKAEAEAKAKAEAESKAKAEAEAKAKAEAEAKAKAEAESKAKAEAEAKAKAEAEAKAKAEAEAKAKAEAESKAKAKASSQTSITCVKGKSSLKVIGKNPKCPKGYKRK